jgi:hypothetical protein
MTLPSPKFSVKNLDFLKTIDPSGKLYDGIKSIQDEINAQKSQTGAAGTGQPSTPPKPAQLNVAASGGIFQINVTDQTPGVQYTLEYSPLASFVAPRSYPLNPGQNSWRASLGNQTLFWRVKSSYPLGPTSEPTYFGTSAQPTPVVGGGAAIGPPA